MHISFEGPTLSISPLVVIIDIFSVENFPCIYCKGTKFKIAPSIRPPPHPALNPHSVHDEQEDGWREAAAA